VGERISCSSARLLAGITELDRRATDGAVINDAVGFLVVIRRELSGTFSQLRAELIKMLHFLNLTYFTSVNNIILVTFWCIKTI
jgi:hypothetical protein